MLPVLTSTRILTDSVLEKENERAWARSFRGVFWAVVTVSEVWLLKMTAMIEWSMYLQHRAKEMINPV